MIYIYGTKGCQFCEKAKHKANDMYGEYKFLDIGLTLYYNKLKELNDDYEIERKYALKDIFVTVLPERTFMDFMKHKGKIGGQHKFPRVLKGSMLKDWQSFLDNY